MKPQTGTQNWLKLPNRQTIIDPLRSYFTEKHKKRSPFGLPHSVNKLLTIQLTNRLHVAVRLFSNRSQMTSKCGKNKKVAHEAITEYVTDFLTTV